MATSKQKLRLPGNRIALRALGVRLPDLQDKTSQFPLLVVWNKDKQRLSDDGRWRILQQLTHRPIRFHDDSTAIGHAVTVGSKFEQLEIALTFCVGPLQGL